ncbi:MAG: asparagine synthase (glutamine-hydrolyzing) [Alphaproteobacteria bacterium]|nr:asparagine synthase (glutamine-hydrolyzing) [Alphaproteobacteria bacterium]
MCGIAGFLNLTQKTGPENLAAQVKMMTDAIAHRGPDDSGAWCDAEAGIALGHRRLSIIDLSPLGHQPMESRSGRYVMVFNGEIYNFPVLRTALEGKGHVFRGHSDTEVLLGALEEFGLADTLPRLNGMFAFAVWDKKERTLSLARDRVGKKPLYYGRSGDTLFFASELKAIRAHPDFTPALNREALAAYLQRAYVPGPLSIYEGIHKLPPASYITLPAQAAPTSYWDIQAIAENGQRALGTTNFENAVDELDGILDRAVARRMMSDVPLGAFLSGGIDSSLITALMQKNAAAPVRTFCIGFEEAGYNEAQDAKKIAAHLGTDHTELTVTAGEARSVIPDLPDYFDEPFADPSQIPTYCVSKLAREHVTVALSGDGGDETFAGYPRYGLAEKMTKTLFACPYMLRAPAGHMLRLAHGGTRLQRIAGALGARGRDDFYAALMSYWSRPERLLLSADHPPPFAEKSALSDFTHRMMLHDTRRYLPDDILVKVDRASMAVSLEARAPLLDYEVMEFAWTLPLEMKRDKRILKALLERYVPRPLFDRPKQGFGIPHGAWLRGPLKDWAEALLDERRLKDEGLFNPAPIRRAWADHTAGRRDWGQHLWIILMAQAWRERWL